MRNEVSKQYTWTLDAYEHQGRLWLKWSTTDAIRAHNGQVRVYKGSFPQNPADDIAVWLWDDNTDVRGNWDTGLTWGTDWHCAIVANPNHAFSNASQMYILQLVTTVDN